MVWLRTWSGLVTLGGIVVGLALAIILAPALPVWVTWLLPILLGTGAFFLGRALFPPEPEIELYLEEAKTQQIQASLAALKQEASSTAIFLPFRDVLLKLIERLEKIFPETEAMGQTEARYTIRRLIVEDLPGLLEPYRRLSEETRRANEALLRESLEELAREVDGIYQLIEDEDRMALERKITFVREKYARRREPRFK